MSRPEPGERIGRYEVIDALGEGGMATVYRVRHTLLESEHALKLLTNRSRESRERLVREGQATRGLRHPNVVEITDLVEDEGRLALVMELVQGRTLQGEIAHDPPDLERALALFRNIADGVEAAHNHGLVHRDLKPANVLVTGDGVAKVTDFGLTKAESDDPEDPMGLSQTGVAMGTPRYMAPEQIRDGKRVDRRADVWALGAILYELVTGHRAFDGPHTMAVLRAVSKVDYVPPLERMPDLPPTVANAIEGALQLDREDRFAHVGAMIRALEGGEPTPAPTPRRRAGVVAAVGGGAAFATVAGLVTVAVLLGLVGGLLWFRDPGDPPHPDHVIDTTDGVCPGLRGTLIGYAYAGRRLKLDKGVWTPRVATNVRTSADKDSGVVCVLPLGARVEVTHDPIDRGRAVWVPIVAGQISEARPAR